MDLTDKQWDAIKRFVPGPEKQGTTAKGGRPWRDPRDVLHGILWILRTGAPWADLPRRYPPYQTCHRRFQKWEREGVLDRILRAVARDLFERGKLDLTEAFIDGTHAGKATKSMAVADRSGLPIAVWTAPGQRGETKLVLDTLRARFLKALPLRLIGDRAYDSDPLDAELADMGIEMIAPHNPTRKRITQDGTPAPPLQATMVCRTPLRVDDALPSPRHSLRAQREELPRLREARLSTDSAQEVVRCVLGVELGQRQKVLKKFGYRYLELLPYSYPCLISNSSKRVWKRLVSLLSHPSYSMTRCLLASLLRFGCD